MLFGGTILAAAEDMVITLTSGNFDSHISSNKHTLVEFYAPWCGHCKKLAPEYEKAAGILADKNIFLAQVDATEQRDLASKYNVKGFPTLIWFEDGKEQEYDGGRTTDTIVEWVNSMIGAAVTATMAPPEPSGNKPRIVLYASSLLASFEAAAKANRRKASWYHVKTDGTPRVLLQHKGEDPVGLTSGTDDKEQVTKLLSDNLMPLFGRLDGDTFDKYLELGRGLVWSLFPSEGSFEEVEMKHRSMMTEVAKEIKGKYFVTITDTDAFKDAIDSMLSVKEFPAIAVQKKSGDKHKFVYSGDMSSANILKFIRDVEAGEVQPKLKTDPEPAASDDPVQTVVSTTLKREVFTADKDVLLFVHAPWCGHCKKLDPEYNKLAKKIVKEELTDLLKLAKLDGTTNDSPVDSMDWTGFPTLYFVKAASSEPTLYEGERTAKGIWKYIKKHATKADEIRERIERRKQKEKKGDEL